MIYPFFKKILKPLKKYPYILLITLAIFIPISSMSDASPSKKLSYNENSFAIHSYPQSIASVIKSTPSITSVVNLPIIEQKAPPATPTPLNGYPIPELVTPIATFTPTVTPIPIQTGATNVPIVLGALAIIAVVVLAWFFVGYIPHRSKV